MTYLKSLAASLFVVLFFLSSACQMAPVGLNNSAPNNQVSQTALSSSPNQSKNSVPNSGTTAFDSTALIERIKAKKPYTGKIEIKVNPGLFKNESSPQTIQIENELNASGFQVQAVPAGPVVFQKEYLKGHAKLEETHAIPISDTSKRYTLHVQKSHPGLEVQININGSNWIKEQDFKGKELEAQNESLLLNSNNSLRIRLEGKAGGMAKVTLVEGGQAGTLLRRNGKLRQFGETQATHVRRNDTNIFDPNDPNSLGGLTPYIGNIEFEHNGKKVSLSRSKINNQDELDFETGVFQVEFTSETAKANFEAEYGAQVIDFTEVEGKKVYLLKADLTKSPIGEIASLLRSYNLGVPVDITSTEFSSLASIQTFAIALDTFVNHPEWINGLGLNIAGKGGGEQLVEAEWNYNPYTLDVSNPNVAENFTKVNFDLFMVNAQIPKLDGPAENRAYGHYNWGIADTYVPNAWNYSIGTGVKVAWLDENVIPNHPELNRRYLFNQSNPPNKVCTLCVIKNTILNEPVNISQANHGHFSMMVGFAEKDNGIFATGVAPNSQVMPFSDVVLHWHMVKALQSIREQNFDVDIVGTSVYWPVSGYGFTYFLGALGGAIIPPLSAFGRSPGLEYELLALGHKEIPFINLAGNEGRKNQPNNIFDNGYSYIAGLNFPGVITVSNAYKVTNSESVADPLLFKASFFPGLENLFLNFRKAVVANDRLSNYYQSINSYWAPGTLIPVADYLMGGNKLTNNIPYYFSGTSAASPFLTGVIALMKSRNPDLTIAQIKQILDQTGRPLDVIQYNKTDLIQSKTRFIDALAAVKAAIALKEPSNNIEAYQATTYYGLITPDRKIKLPGIAKANSSPDAVEKQLIQSISNEMWNNHVKPGDLVSLMGWTNIQSGKGFVAPNQLEVLQANRICTLDNNNKCTNINGYFQPLISSMTVDPSIPNTNNGFKLLISGEKLIPLLRDENVGLGRFLLHIKSSTNTQPHLTIPILDTQIVNIGNDGSYAEILVPPFSLPNGSYVFSLEGIGKTPYFPEPPNGIQFTNSPPFDNSIISAPPVGQTPSSVSVDAFYDPHSSSPITVRAGDTIGLFIKHFQYRNLVIEIQGKNAIYTKPTDNMISLVVPADLSIGNLDVLFKSDEGEFKIENLLNYTSPFPEVVKFSKPTIFSNGGDVVDAYITVKGQNGQLAPDGTLYYIQLMPTHIGLYPDLVMINPETGQEYGGKWTTVEQVFPTRNGKIHFKVKLTAPISPHEYTYNWATSTQNGFTWPHAEAPGFQVQVCNPAYSSSKPGYGYYCGSQVFPQTGNTLDGRLYAVHAYSFDPQIHYFTAGSPARTITIRGIKDILGNPVPAGTVLYSNQTYYGNVSNPNGNDIYWGVAVTTPGEVEIVYEPIQRFYCGFVGGEEFLYLTSVQGASSSSLHWLVGNPVYLKYIGC